MADLLRNRPFCSNMRIAGDRSKCRMKERCIYVGTTMVYLRFAIHNTMLATLC